MKVKLDTMSLISAAIAVAIWVVVIWTAVAAIVAHIYSLQHRTPRPSPRNRQAPSPSNCSPAWRVPPCGGGRGMSTRRDARPADTKGQVTTSATKPTSIRRPAGLTARTPAVADSVGGSLNTADDTLSRGADARCGA